MRILVYFSFVLLLVSCQPENNLLNYCFQDTKSCVRMEASRIGALEDFQVKLTITNGFSRYNDESAALELPMSSFSEEEIDLSWESERKCRFSFLLRDGTTRTYLLSMEENRFHLRQI